MSDATGHQAAGHRPPATGFLPVETDDPANGLLDALETLLRTMSALGMESQIRARLNRLFPPPPPPAPASFAPSDSRSGSRPEGAEGVTKLELSILLTGLREASELRLPGAAHAVIARLRSRVLALMTS